MYKIYTLRVIIYTQYLWKTIDLVIYTLQLCRSKDLVPNCLQAGKSQYFKHKIIKIMLDTKTYLLKLCSFYPSKPDSKPVPLLLCFLYLFDLN